MVVVNRLLGIFAQRSCELGQLARKFTDYWRVVMTHNSIVDVVVLAPVADCHSDEYLVKLGSEPNATDEQIEEAFEALNRLEAKHRDALATEDRLDREAKAAAVAKLEQADKVAATIKRVEANIKNRFRDGLVQRGGQRVLDDSAKVKGLAARFDAAVSTGNLGGAVAALKELRQANIAAGMLHHFGSVRAHDEFLFQAGEQLKRLRAETPGKKRGKRRT